MTEKFMTKPPLPYYQAFTGIVRCFRQTGHHLPDAMTHTR